MRTSLTLALGVFFATNVEIIIIIMTIRAATNDGVLIAPATKIVIVTALETADAASHAVHHAAHLTLTMIVVSRLSRGSISDHHEPSGHVRDGCAGRERHERHRCRDIHDSRQRSEGKRPPHGGRPH